jgi:hypothetical protein
MSSVMSSSSLLRKSHIAHDGNEGQSDNLLGGTLVPGEDSLYAW